MESNLEKIQENQVKENVTKPKKERTEAQKANTERMRLALLAKHEASRKAKDEAEAIKAKTLEEKVLKKAAAIKKREAKTLKVIESIPDDESDEELEAPIETPKPKAKKQIKKQPPTPPPTEDEESQDEYDAPAPPMRHKPVQQYVPQQQQRYVPQRPIIRYV